MVENKIITPDQSVINVYIGADNWVSLTPRDPTTDLLFDCTGYIGAGQLQLQPLESDVQPRTDNAVVTLTDIDADDTGYRARIAWTNIMTLIDAYRQLGYAGYLYANNAGGDTALIWAGELQLRGNAATIKDFHD